MKELNEAYTVLSNETKRREHDDALGRRYLNSYTRSNHTLFSSTDENSMKINLPSLAIFTGKIVENNSVNVLLLGDYEARLSRVALNLRSIDKFQDDNFLSTTRIDCLPFSPSKVTEFQLCDTAGQTQNGFIPANYIHTASIILIFNNFQSNLYDCNRCLNNPE